MTTPDGSTPELAVFSPDAFLADLIDNAQISILASQALDSAQAIHHFTQNYMSPASAEAAAGLLENIQNRHDSAQYVFPAPEGYLFAFTPSEAGLVPSLTGAQDALIYAEFSSIQPRLPRLVTTGRFLANTLEVTEDSLKGTNALSGVNATVQPPYEGNLSLLETNIHYQ